MAEIQSHVLEQKGRYVRKHKGREVALRGVITDIAGAMAERRTYLCARELETRYPGTVQIVRIEEGIAKSGYFFRPGRNGPPEIEFKREERTNFEGEVDLVIKVNGWPLILETRLEKYATRQRGSGKSLSSSLRMDRVRHKTKPISQLFGGQVTTMAYVVPESQLEHALEEASNMHRFLEEGGFIIAFPWDRKGWQRLAERSVYQLVA